LLSLLLPGGGGADRSTSQGRRAAAACRAHLRSPPAAHPLSRAALRWAAQAPPSPARRPRPLAGAPRALPPGTI
jgi:hypothetical protein